MFKGVITLHRDNVSEHVEITCAEIVSENLSEVVDGIHFFFMTMIKPKPNIVFNGKTIEERINEIGYYCGEFDFGSVRYSFNIDKE